MKINLINKQINSAIVQVNLNKMEISACGFFQVSLALFPTVLI